MGLRDKIRDLAQTYAQQAVSQANSYQGLANTSSPFNFGTIQSISGGDTASGYTAVVSINGQTSTVTLDTARLVGVGDTVYVYNGVVAQ